MPPVSALSQRPLLAFGLAIAIGVAVWVAATVLIEPDPTFVSGRRCPHDSGFTCLVLNVPRDHLDPTSGSWEVTFAVQGASQERKGTLVVATGGPGSSGVAVADLYASYFNVRVLEDYELVFFDQRGIGQSQPLQCPRASLAWYSTPEMPTGSEEDQAAFREATGTDAEDALSDLLADLMHWADRSDYDFEAALLRGRGHYGTETAAAEAA